MTAAPSLHALPGQEKAKTLLRRAFQGTKMGHAFLFRGPAGVGKKRLALAFAAYVNCEAPLADDACGRCRSCHKFATANHPDFLPILPAGAQIKIEQIRELKKKLTFPPFEARFRVVLIGDIHQNLYRREVANSLLKTLEEPPADTIFILTADEAAAILPTINSRCQGIPFFGLAATELAPLLARELSLPPEAAVTVAALAGGSLGQARLLVEKKLLEFRREIVEQLTRLKPEAAEGVEVVFQLAATAANQKENLPELFELLKIWLHDLFLLTTASGDSRLVNADLAHTYAAARQRWSFHDLSARVQRLDEAKIQLRQNCNPGLVCEVLFFALL